MRSDHIMVFDDPAPEQPLTKRQKWSVRLWAFRMRMRLRKRLKSPGPTIVIRSKPG